MNTFLSHTRKKMEIIRICTIIKEGNDYQRRKESIEQYRNHSYTEKNGDQRNMGDYWKIGKIIR